MKPKTVILMVLAVACGLGASFMTSRLLAERQSGEAEKEKVKILVAKKNLDMALIVKNPNEMFEEKLVNKEDAPKEAIEIKDEKQYEDVLAQLKGRQLKVGRIKGDFISLDFMLDKASSGLNGTLPEGHRAIGIRVNMESIAGGFAALPHSRVDIIQTVRRGDDKSTFSQVLLENVLVLAADTVSQRDENNRAMPANVVTVALTTEELLKINVAKEIGSLSLALRRFGDTKSSDQAKITVEDVLSRRNRGEEQDDEEAYGPGPQGANLPRVGSKKAAAPVVAAAKVDDSLTWNLTVFEGERERTTSYALDSKTGQVIRHDVTRSAIEETPQATGSTPAAATGKGPAGSGSDWGK